MSSSGRHTNPLMRQIERELDDWAAQQCDILDQLGDVVDLTNTCMARLEQLEHDVREYETSVQGHAPVPLVDMVRGRRAESLRQMIELRNGQKTA